MYKLIIHEFYKLKNTLALRAAVVIPLILTGLITSIFVIKSADFLKLAQGNLWLDHLSFMLGAMGTLILPFYIIFLAFSINEIEHKADTWKNLLTQPFPKRYIFLSKLVVAMLILFLFLICTAIFTIISGNIIGMLKPELNFQLYNINGFIFQVYSKMFLASIAVLCLQFFFSMLWSEFMKSMGIGFVLTVACVIAMRWEYIYIIPYAQPLYAISHLLQKDAALAVNFNSKEIWFGLSAALGFTSMAYLLMIKKSIR